MALFSKLKEKLFSERELDFNAAQIRKDIVRLSELLYEHRSDTSHEIYTDYLRKLLNLEILQLSEGKERTAENYAYHRGRIESLRQALNVREKFIMDKKQTRDTPVAKRRGVDHEAKRTYFKPSAVSAGMSD